MDLAGWERAKFELAELLQTIVVAKAAEADPSLRDRLQDLLVRLAEDRFELIVAGRFSRGKSSLMNAVLGKEWLPTGILPLTSVITSVTYGTDERVTLRHGRGRLGIEIAMAELANVVTERGNPGNRLGLERVDIELPAEILRRGFHFVDTPGLGSVIPQNELTTRAHLPEADALLLVTGVESPLGEEEEDFCCAAARSGMPIFIAINKMDLVGPADRDQVLSFVRSRLPVTGTDEAAQVFVVSARDGLAARLNGDVAGLEASGLPALEAALTRFLLDRKRTVFHARMRRRIAELADDLPDFDGIADLRKRIAATTPQGDGRTDAAGSAVATPPIGGCEVCETVERRMRELLTRLQYRLSIDPAMRADFARHGGFCCHHSAEHGTTASTFALSSTYPPLFDRLAHELRRAAADDVGISRHRLHQLSPSPETCPLCNARDTAESTAVAAIARRLGEPDSMTSSTDPPLLCLPHLAQLAEIVQNRTVLSMLIERQADAFERIGEDMRRFTLKQSAARRYLMNREEMTAAERGLVLLAGRPEVTVATGRTTATAAARRPAPQTRSISPAFSAESPPKILR